MSEIKDGGPAFPRDAAGFDFQGQRVVSASAGMSLRDYFAGQALAFLRFNDYAGHGDAARLCYELADAMLAERDKR